MSIFIQVFLLSLLQPPLTLSLLSQDGTERTLGCQTTREVPVTKVTRSGTDNLTLQTEKQDGG